MTRGFTLIELLIVLFILAVVSISAAPSFGAISQTIKMQRLASELNGFLIQAKSEAVSRNEDLKIVFSFASTAPQSTGDWYIELVDADGVQLQYFDGEPFQGITVAHNYASSINDPLPITFEKLRGRPAPGSLLFYPTHHSQNQLKAVLSNPPGRIKICAVGQALYDYPDCAS